MASGAALEPAAARTHERELTAPVTECTPQGRLDRRAIGWSRHPLHRCNLSGRFPRKKRWDYWCVTTTTHLFSVTYADLDYLGLVSAGLLDYAENRFVERTIYVPLARGFSQPETVGGGDMRFEGSGLRLEILEEPGGTRLRAAFGGRGADTLEADLRVARPPGHETLNVLIPWSDSCFQFTSKHNTRPAAGSAVVNGRRYEFGAGNQAFGCLDFGRGVWPWRCTWNWASASGMQGGRVVGLNLGGQWTDGTGMTENGICLDGTLHKIGEELRFEYDRRRFAAPWRIRAPRSGCVDLGFTPFHEKTARLELGLLATDLHVLFGRFSGHVLDADGERVEIRDLVGWSEEHRARW